MMILIKWFYHAFASNNFFYITFVMFFDR